MEFLPGHFQVNLRGYYFGWNSDILKDFTKFSVVGFSSGQFSKITWEWILIILFRGLKSSGGIKFSTNWRSWALANKAAVRANLNFHEHDQEDAQVRITWFTDGVLIIFTCNNSSIFKNYLLNNYFQFQEITGIPHRIKYIVES